MPFSNLSAGIAEVQRLQKELTEMARKVQTAQAGLRGYIGAITTAQEEERRRLARELHDDTIQAIIALKQRIQLTEQTVRDPAVQRMLNELEDLAAQTIENLRRMTRALRPIYLEDLGLARRAGCAGARGRAEQRHCPLHSRRQARSAVCLLK
jgi:two-component system sensor histidine kinase UhpB